MSPTETGLNIQDDTIQASLRSEFSQDDFMLVDDCSGKVPLTRQIFEWRLSNLVLDHHAQGTIRPCISQLGKNVPSLCGLKMVMRPFAHLLT